MFKMPKNKSPTHIFVKLNTIEDLTRMSCALEKIPFMIFSYKQKQNYMFYVDYHQINHVKISYCVENPSIDNFLSYVNSNGSESVSLINKLSGNNITSPVVLIENSRTISKTTPKLDKIGSVFVPNLYDLCKAVSYSSSVHDSAIPFFKFHSKNNAILGTFLNTFYDDGVDFYYTKLDSDVSENFVKGDFYSEPNNGFSFTNSIEEHGSFFIKIINLPNAHPMVKL